MGIEALPDGESYINGGNVTVFYNVSNTITVDELHDAGFADGWTLRSSGNLKQPVILSHISEYGGDWGQESDDLFITALLNGKFFSPSDLGQYSTSHNGTGGAWSAMFQQTCNTGVTATSYGNVYSPISISGSGTFDWNKKLYLSFGYFRAGGSSANTISRVKLSPAQVGALNGHGLGIKVENMALFGITYGSDGTEEAVDLSTTLVDGMPVQISIVFTPSTKVEWYVNGILKGTQSLDSDLPSSSGYSYLVHEITNGADASDRYSNIISPIVWVST